MSRVILIARAVTGALFLSQLVLGMVMWTGRGQSLVQLHLAVGALFVLAVWTVSATCAHAGASRPASLGVAIVGAIVLLFGQAQAQILPGPSHWVVRVVHLLLGFLAMAVAARLTTLVPAVAHPSANAGAPRTEPAPSGRRSG